MNQNKDFNYKRVRKKLALFVFLAFLSIQAIAQTNSRIEGRLVKSQDKEPVMYASVALIKLPDSAMVKGNMTDENGVFRFDEIRKGKYHLEFSCVGFENLEKTDITIDDATKDINLGEISMQQKSENIDEVVVSEDRLKAEEQVDRTVYYMNDKIVQSSSSGIDLLKHIPAVQVDFQENITIAGEENVLILIDGKQRDKDFLAQLAPSRIDKVEVMTEPSVKYDSEVSAVINVILKREKKHGFSGGFKAEAPGGLNIFNERANIEYGYNKIRVWASGRTHIESLDIEDITTRRTTTSGVETRMEQIGNGTGKYMYTDFSGGIDWFIDDKKTLSYYANIKPNRGFESEMDITQSIFVDDQLSGYTVMSNKVDDTGDAVYHSLYYKQTFEKQGQELTADINLYNYNGVKNNNYTENYYGPDKTTSLYGELNRFEHTKNARSKIGVKIDYTHPINEKHKLLLGFENYSQFMDNEYDKSDDALLNELDYEDIRNAVYGSISGAVKKFSYSAGVRAEYNLIDFQSEENPDYVFLAPNVSLQYKLNKGQSVKLHYKRSFHRPGINELNPFIYTPDSTTITYGDPNIKPAKINRISLKYSAPFGKSFLSPELSFTTFYDGVDWINIVNEDGITEAFPQNIGKGGEVAFSVSGSLKLTKWWQLNPYVSVFRKVQKGSDEYNIDDNARTSYRVSMSSVFSLPKDYTISSFVYYGSPHISTQRTFYRDAIYVVSASKKVLKTGKIELSWILPFDNDFTFRKEVRESENYYKKNSKSIKFDYFIQAGFSYNFNIGSKVKKLNRNLNNENDGSGGMM